MITELVLSSAATVGTRSTETLLLLELSFKSEFIILATSVADAYLRLTDSTSWSPAVSTRLTISTSLFTTLARPVMMSTFEGS